MRTAFEAEGDLRSTEVLAALVALWREGASGTLRFSRSGASSGFELSAGEILSSTSSDPRFDTAAILVRAGKLEASTLERLVVPEGADRAHSALQAGILTKREWRWGEKIRAVEVLSDLLTWIEGDYSFFRTGPREAGEFRLTIPRLILELFLRSRDRSLVLHHLGGVDVPLVRDARFETEFSTFGLTDDAESVVHLIDGETTAAEIAAEAPAEAFAVEKLLAALVTLGLVHPAYAVEEAIPEDPARSTAAIEAPSAPPLVDRDEEPGVEEEPPLEEEELEPEVDIQDKFEPAPPPVSVSARAADQSLDEEAPPAESPIDADFREPDEGEPEDAREESGVDEAERLASDLVATDNADPGLDASPAVPAEEGALDEAPETDERTGMPYDFHRPLDTSTGVGDLERPRQRSSTALFVVLGLLVAATAAVVYWRSRGEGTGGEPIGLAGALPTPIASGEAVEPIRTAPPMPAVGAPPTAPAVEASPAPTARPRPTAAAGPPAGAGARTASAAAATRPRSHQGWLDRAERDRKSAAADREARFTVQLELACELPSLAEAYAHDRPPGSMWLVPASFRGRTCFRVLWGRFPTRDAAVGGLAGAPAFFSTPRNHPMVVAIPDALR